MPRPQAEVNHAREFEKRLRSLDRHQPWRVFADFCELAALSLANRVVKSDAREARYFKIREGYDAQENALFPEMLGCVAAGLAEAEGETDFLGSVFQSLELANHWKGQFFSPFPLCMLMAQLTFDGVEEVIRERGFVTVSEPACGAGAMVLAAATALRRKNIDPSHHMWVSAIDVDSTAAHMAFIQFSLCGIPAEVVIGDTLRMELRETFLTPYHYLGLWDSKLRLRFALDAAALGADVSRGAAVAEKLPTPPADVPSSDAPAMLPQLRLF